MRILPSSMTGAIRRSADPRRSIAPADRSAAWRRFFLALGGLALAFFLALYATALREAGRYEMAAATAIVSLALAGVVAVKTVPYLARRTRLERFVVKIDYGFTREGLVYLLAVIVIIVAALNTGNNLLFMILASLLAGILVSGVLSAIVLADLELDFALPERIFAGQPAISRLTVHNSKQLLPSFSITVSASDRVKAKGWRDSTPQLSTPQGLLDGPIYLPYIPHGTLAVEHAELTFPRRGRYTQDGFRVSTKFPFGLMRKSREIPSRQEILVLPGIEPTEEFYEILPLISGEIESFHKGRGHDLYAIRDYQQSDNARHVDWKATAKTRELKVREFAREDERRVALVFDAEISGADEKSLAKFEKAVTFCACLAWHFYEINAQMQFVTWEFETVMTTAAEIIYPTLEHLALIEPHVAPGRADGSFLASVASQVPGFRIVLTSQSRGSIPTSLWGSSYLIFYDSL